ncbi:hypothetical protein Tco_1420334 [Tanacetum coccineum]
MLKKFGLEDSKPMKTPMSTETKLTKDEEGESVDNTKYRGMIGSLLYLMASRPDIMFSVCLCARFQEDPKNSHLEAKQTALVISNTEAEYVSARKACQQELWMKQALIDDGIRLYDILIMCDNKGAIDLNKNPVQDSRTKHIKIRHHFLRDNVQKGNISIEKVSSEDNIADILTKPLKREAFNYLCLVASVLHAQTPPSPQGDNHTQPPLPLSPSREMLMNDNNQLQDLSNLLAMHLSQRNTPTSPYSPNLPHTLNLDQVEQHVGYYPLSRCSEVVKQSEVVKCSEVVKRSEVVK